MLAAEQLRLLVGVCVVTCVLAEAGDDFSNNLFTDLAPLLALFGERVTMQFMSQSMGWADNIILAMAPLGIITAIVGAIRVGGPSWLKAIIGRARESRAVAESELMSSTSNEVCELWNGQEIVRVMGSGPIREFVVLLPKYSGRNEDPAEMGGLLSRLFNRLTRRHPDDGQTSSTEMYQEMYQEMRAMGLKDRGEEVHKYLEEYGRGDLYMVALLGIVLQLGVLVYSGFATYYLVLPKDGNPMAGYAFPCTASGTLLLVAGMLLCAHVVEASTLETRYRPGPGKEARVIWLQKSGIVNDQAFEPFVIFPQNAQAFVITSHRARGEQGQNWQIKIPHRLRPVFDIGVKVQEVITVAGALVSITGFVIQFTGLRGMHWSASVTQLGVVIVMTILRAWVRRNLAKSPDALPLISGHELDWLAMTLGKPAKAPWLLPLKTYTGWSEYSRPWAEGDGWDWKIAAVEDPEGREMLKYNSNTDGRGSRSRAHKLMKIRRDLGELADWFGPASAEAISLARAIEITMDALFSTHTGEFTWSLTVHEEQVHFRLSREKDGRWETHSDELESTLSLWLYFVHKKEQGKGKERDEVRRKAVTATDTWLRAKGTPAKPSLQLLGSHTAALYRDLQWWMPDGPVRVIGVEVDNSKSKTDSGTMEVEAHRVVGFTSNPKSLSFPDISVHRYRRKSLGSPRRGSSLAVESFSPLTTLYAQYMFAAFMWAAAKMMEKPLEDGVDVRPAQSSNASGDSALQPIALQSSRLSKMAQDIQTTGLGSLEEIYLAVIPPLSARDRLPRADAIVEWTREQARSHEQLGHWKDAADVYMQLFRTAETFPAGDDIVTKATALLVEYLKAVTDAIELRKAQLFEERDIQELEQLKSELDAKLQTGCGSRILADLMGLHDVQGRSWQCSFVKKSKAIKGENTKLKFTSLHKAACFDDLNIERTIDSARANERDIFGWTPLHYAAVKASSATLQKLLTYRADVNAQDIRRRTPLHYACWHDDDSTVRSLLQEGAEMNIRDIDGMAPIHHAVVRGHRLAMQLLIKAGATIDVADGLGNTPLLWATYKAHVDLVEELWEYSNATLRNRNGRTPLHLAAMAGIGEASKREKIVELLLEKGADKEAKDNGGRTPLYLAAIKGHETVVRLLLEKGANKDAKDGEGRTPLYQAAIKGHEPVVRLLLEKDANKDAKDGEGRTPLSLAARNGHEGIVKLLLAAGKVDVESKDKYGSTPLSLAAGGGHEEIVKLLLATDKVDVESKDYLEWTPLSSAAKNGHEGIVKLLLATGKNGHEGIVKLLLATGKVDIESKDMHGRTPLSLAAEKGHKGMIKLLLATGKVDVESKDNYGRTPLSSASKNGHEGIVKLLLGTGKVDVDSKDNLGWTPFFSAAMKGH
ncbi:hypothetical protein DL768_009575 [Monosporascus sp. mg162]|nr:hypothetical protein DL768_009575 [Monosporascus sp. mg162]